MLLLLAERNNPKADIHLFLHYLTDHRKTGKGRSMPLKVAFKRAESGIKVLLLRWVFFSKNYVSTVSFQLHFLHQPFQILLHTLF